MISRSHSANIFDADPLAVGRQLAELPERPRARLGLAGKRQISAVDEERAAGEWRDRLGASGPVFVAAGLYWASRVDSLPSVLRRALGELADSRFWPMPIPDPLARLGDVIGQPPERLFHLPEPLPGAATLFYERFRARFTGEVPGPGPEPAAPFDGGPSPLVDLRLARPELDTAQADLKRLDRVAPALETWSISRDPETAMELIESAREAIGHEIDLHREAEAFEALLRDRGSFLFGHGWDTPRVYRSLSSAELLTTEARDLEPWASAPSELRHFGPTAKPDGRELAERLCLAWLRQALLGCRLPAAPSPCHLALAPEGRLRVIGGGFVRPKPAWQDRLATYLVALGTQDPDSILEALGDLLDRPPGDPEALRSRLRQQRPLREGRDFAPMGRLASPILLHWRWIAEAGARPDESTSAFFRGVYLLEQTLRTLAPDFDPWPLAVERVRLEKELATWRERLHPMRLGQELSEGIAWATRLPAILDSATTALEGGLRVRLELPEDSVRSLAASRGASRFAVPPSILLLVLVALIAGLGLGFEPSAAPASAAGASDTIRGLILLLIGFYIGASWR